MTIQEINQSLEVKSVKGLKFGNKKVYCMTKGYGLYHKDLGFLAFKADNEGYPAPKPYTPLGGKEALESILECGGFDNYDEIEWMHPIKISKKETATLPR